MPLKHDTETALVFFLGLIVALAGAAAAFLPPVSVNVFPWVIAFAVSLAYPLMLYPMLKDRRADYEFRGLHFVPALILLLWLLLDLAASFQPDLQMFQDWYTWGWTLPMVGAAFVLLLLFCFRVIRQRLTRTGLLFVILLPFLYLSWTSEQEAWDRQLAMSLWDREETSSGVLAGGGNSSNLSPSDHAEEEQWRMKLRNMERRRQQIIGQTGTTVVHSAKDSVIIAAAGLPPPPKVGGNGTNPPKLPSSGFGIEGLVIMMLAGYCAMLHKRAIKV